MPAKKSASKSTVHSGRVTKSEPLQITSADEWGKEARTNRVEGRPLKVPSGKVCLVKMLDSMAEFLSRGNVPNALLPLMTQAAQGKTETAKSVTDEVLANPENLMEMYSLIDTVVVECVLQPPVAPVPQRQVDYDGSTEPVPAHERPDDNTLYVDYIELEDKLFIFNYALSGVSDVEQFRAGYEEGMVPVSAVNNVERSAE